MSNIIRLASRRQLPAADGFERLTAKRVPLWAVLMACAGAVLLMPPMMALNAWDDWQARRHAP